MSTQLAASKKEHRSNTQEFLSGKLAQVDIARIEKEIKGLWKSASQTDQSGSAQESVTRACAMNLILFSEDEDAEKVAGDVLDDITSRHPCRAILAISRKASRPSLEAWVSARCHINDSKSRKQICCEQITVRGEGTTHDELASVVLPLILPDLPVFMWWRANNVTLSRIKPFVSYLDEIILDSAKHSAGNGPGANFFSEVLNIIGAHDKARPFQIVVSDLNWRRCLLWREALALSFDDNKGRVPLAALQQIKSVEINYVSNSGTLSHQAVLYTGWLSNRLGWQFRGATKNEGAIKLQFNANGQTVDVNLCGVKCDGSGSDDLCSVQVVFTDAKLPQLKVMRDAGAPGVQVHRVNKASANENTSSQNLFRLDQQTESRLMDLELETCDRDGVLESSYRVAADITAELNK